jgi:hypothetical protein
MAWYFLMTVIVVVGIGLIVYSRDEVLRVPEGPTAKSNWYAALSIDICGKVEPGLPASANTATNPVGIGSVGSGLINARPSLAGAGAAAYEGPKATLGLFAKGYAYSGLRLTNHELRYPGKGRRTWTDGESCTGPVKGKGELVAKIWNSPTAVSSRTSSTPAEIHISNGEMITVAFMPAGTPIPAPPSRAVSDLEDLITGQGLPTTSTVPTSTTTTLPKGSTTTTTSAVTTTTTPGTKKK